MFSFEGMAMIIFPFNMCSYCLGGKKTEYFKQWSDAESVTLW